MRIRAVLDLVGTNVGDVAGEDGLPPRHHCLVVHLLSELGNNRLRWQPWSVNNVKTVNNVKLKMLALGDKSYFDLGHEVTENSVWREVTEFRENQTLLATRNNTKHLV